MSEVKEKALTLKFNNDKIYCEKTIFKTRNALLHTAYYYICSVKLILYAKLRH